MIITPLGHTEFLLDIENLEGQNVRILVDSWLSGFSISDLMERTVDIDLIPDGVKSIDALYISHAHADHLDPYTLTRIYDIANPRLILPCTLGYLVPLLEKYLPNAPIEILFPEKSLDICGVKITGHMFPQSDITNEDDVMMISIDSSDELVFAEIDALPEEDNLEVQKALYPILTRKEYSTVCYLATRNELEGQLKILDLEPSRQRSFRDEYIASRKEEMRFSYEKFEYEDFASFPNIFTIPNFVRGFIGQGIAYPSELSGELFSFQIFPLDDIASRESDIASSCGYDFPQKALQVGRQYKLENGKIETGRKECSIGNIIKKSSQSEGKRTYADGPLFPRENRDLQNAKIRILEILNSRFIPYWSASPVASLRSAMIESGGVYRIEGKVKNENGRVIFEYSFTQTEFHEVPYLEGMRIDESYWLDDILDFLDGKQDLYSNFWHKLDPKMIYRLWTCLGANFCNHDLVIQKYRLHFDRAKRGDTSGEYFDEIKNSLIL